LLNFTRQERVVVYFLVVTLGIGAVLRLVRNQRIENQLTPNRFYEEEDQFKRIAEQINSDSVQLVDNDGSIVDTIATDSGQKSSHMDLRQDLVNINTAGIEELTTLPGIGPAIAGRVRAYTDEHGPFKDKSDIILVKGIGKKTYTRIQGLVTTE